MVCCPCCGASLTPNSRRCPACAVNLILISGRARGWLLGAAGIVALAVVGLALWTWNLSAPAAVPTKTGPVAVQAPPSANAPAAERVVEDAAVVLTSAETAAQIKAEPKKKKPKEEKKGKGVPPPGWAADYDAALAQAKATGKPIFAVFRCER